MTKYISLIFTIILFSTSVFGQEAAKKTGLQVGDKALDFKLKNIDGKEISLGSYKKEKGMILIFTCNHCPYSVAYEDRIIALHNTYAKSGFPVLAINSNDPDVVPEDSYENMKVRATEKGFPFRYIYDATQSIAKGYGATRTPHVYVLKKEKKGFRISYIGAIDDNSQDAKAVTQKYVENAIAAISKGEKPDPETTKAIGCTIKWKK
ncbi:MAG: thioredoxin family protein [Bacteroidia bacterium]|nr:thioredoxin family protein [Bacteroidia bacterium]